MNHMDVDYYLSKNKYWSQLDAEWGQPVDLDTSTDQPPAAAARRGAPCRRSTLHLPTFASHDFIQNVQVASYKPLYSVTDYEDFKEDVTDENSSIAREDKSIDPRQFYFINGNIMSFQSVEHICQEIDAVFRPVVSNEVKTSTLKNASKRSVLRRTIRKKRAQQFPSIIENSLSISNLSFDESSFGSSKLDSEKETQGTASLSRTPRAVPAARAVEDALFDLSKALRSKTPQQNEQLVNDYIDRVFSVVEDVSRIITTANDDLDISNISTSTPRRSHSSRIPKQRSHTPDNKSDNNVHKRIGRGLMSPSTSKYTKENEIVTSPNFRAVREFWARMT